MDDFLTLIYHFLGHVCLNPLPFKKYSFVCFFIIKENYIYILDANHYFLPICNLSFIFLTLPFVAQKILILMKFSVFLFMGHLFLLSLVYLCLIQGHNFSPMFSSRSFTVLSVHMLLLN